MRLQLVPVGAEILHVAITSQIVIPDSMAVTSRWTGLILP